MYAKNSHVTSTEGANSLLNRNELIEKYRPYVLSVAREVAKVVSSPAIDLDDLVGYGEVGLVEAVDRFDPSRGANFKTYAYYRIKGAIYDGLRSMGWLSRAEYAKLKFEDSVNNLSMSHLDVMSSAGRLSIDDQVAEIEELILGSAFAYILSLDSIKCGQLRDGRQSAAEQYELEETRKNVRSAVEKLPERQRRLIDYYYYQGLSLEEAAKKLGISKSWASRMLAKALRQLRKIVGRI